MKLPTIKRLNKNDFETKMRDFVDKLSYIFNSGLEVVYSALDRRVSIADNILCDVINLNVSVNSSGNPLQSTTFSIGNKNMTSLQGLQVIRAFNSTNSTGYPTSGVFISFSFSNNISSNANITVSVDNITGLIAGNNYQLRIIAWG